MSTANAGTKARYGSVACEVCGRRFRSRRSAGPFACSVACAERYATAPMRALVARWTAKEVAVAVVPGTAWLLLEPLREPELSRRRALLRHRPEGTA